VSKNYRIPNPALGAFEVRISDKLIFSKIERKKWPNERIVLRNLQQVLDDEEKENEEDY